MLNKSENISRCLITATKLKIEKDVLVVTDKRNQAKIFKNFSDEEIIAVLEILEYSSILKKLILRNVDLSKNLDLLVAIGKLIENSLSLTLLDLDGNNIGKNESKIIASSLKHNPHIEHFRLHGSKIDRKAFEKSIEGIKNKKLSKLYVDNVSSPKFKAVMPHISSPYIQEVSLSGDWKLTETKIEDIKKILECNKIEALHLKNNRLRHDNLRMLLKTFDINTSVHSVYFHGDKCGDKEAKVLASFLKSNTSLVKVRLNFDELTQNGISYLANVLPRNRSIFKLDIMIKNGTPISPNICDDLNKELDKNEKLFEKNYIKILTIHESQDTDKLQSLKSSTINRLISQLRFSIYNINDKCTSSASQRKSIKDTKSLILMNIALDECKKYISNRSAISQSEGRSH